MTTLRFDPRLNLIVLNVDLRYQVRHTIRMALDTASTFSALAPDAATRLGFDLSQVKSRQTIATASQTLTVPQVTVPAVTLGTETIGDLLFLIMPLPLPLGVKGLLGLNFMRHFKVALDFEQGILSIEHLPQLH
jgi:predicted aspartyl protease